METAKPLEIAEVVKTSAGIQKQSMTIEAIFEAIAPIIVSKGIEICYDVVKGLIYKVRESPVKKEEVKEESVESNRTGKQTRHQSRSEKKKKGKKRTGRRK